MCMQFQTNDTYEILSFMYRWTCISFIQEAKPLFWVQRSKFCVGKCIRETMHFIFQKWPSDAGIAMTVIWKGECQSTTKVSQYFSMLPTCFSGNPSSPVYKYFTNVLRLLKKILFKFSIHLIFTYHWLRHTAFTVKIIRWTLIKAGSH